MLAPEFHICCGEWRWPNSARAENRKFSSIGGPGTWGGFRFCHFCESVNLHPLAYLLSSFDLYFLSLSCWLSHFPFPIVLFMRGGFGCKGKQDWNIRKAREAWISQTLTQSCSRDCLMGWEMMVKRNKVTPEQRLLTLSLSPVSSASVPIFQEIKAENLGKQREIDFREG